MGALGFEGGTGLLRTASQHCRSRRDPICKVEYAPLEVFSSGASPDAGVGRRAVGPRRTAKELIGIVSARAF